MQGMPADDNTGSGSSGTPPTTVGMGGASAASSAPSTPPSRAQGGGAGAFPGLSGAPLALVDLPQCWLLNSKACACKQQGGPVCILQFGLRQHGTTPYSTNSLRLEVCQTSDLGCLRI